MGRHLIPCPGKTPLSSPIVPMIRDHGRVSNKVMLFQYGLLKFDLQLAASSA